MTRIELAVICAITSQNPTCVTAPYATVDWIAIDDMLARLATQWTVLTYESGDRIYVHKNGTCHAEYNANCGGNGPEITTCNPRPPQQVKCPADAK